MSSLLARVGGVLVVLLVVVGSSLLTPTAPAVRAEVDPLVLGRAVDAVVQLSIVVNGEVDGEQQVIWYAVGSGTIVTADGLILTNEHLIAPDGVEEKLAELEAQLAGEGMTATLTVEDDRFMVAVSDGRHLPVPRYSASVVASDPAFDLAVLHIDGDERGDPLDSEAAELAALPLGSSDAVNLGDAVHVFGFPAIGSGSLTYTAGIVSGFLFEDGIDGVAWINTDAVTSGGNSGGAAVNDRGELIGVPTSGSAPDCRPGDTNRDGVIGPEDVGCVPTGGSLTQLRPIDLAKPLLASVDASFAADAAASAAISTPETDDLTRRLSAAAGCATRGDWRCAANFYREALADSPHDSTITASLYDAYLSLGEQEASAGRLQSARSAFAEAAATDPSRPEADAALHRIAPYSRAVFVDTFEGERHYVASDEGDSSSAYEDGRFTLRISEPGVVSGFPLTREPLSGEDFAAFLRVAETAGDGMVTIETHTDPRGGQWLFAVDPTQRTWEVLELDSASSKFVTWTGPYAYASADSAAERLETVELRVTDGFPLLLVNGVDVATLAGVPLPDIGNQGDLSFGALMASQGTEPFTVSFDEIGLYELT